MGCGKSASGGKAALPRPSRPTSTRSQASTPRSKGTNTNAEPPEPAYRFFGGKGGVGKTTCAAAFAVAAARDGGRTLLISTDPAPSVGDALRQRLTFNPTPVRGVPRLDAVEVDARRGLDRWLRPRRELLETILLRGTWLDREDVASLLEQSLPGIDEIAALLELTRFGRAGRYRSIVVDTAPTGHTLRMLAMPDLLGALAVVFDRMQSKHRAIVEALRGAWIPESSDRLIAEMADEARGLAALLRDRRRTGVTWVTLPEPVTIAETRDGLAELTRLGLHVDRLVINRVTPVPPAACGWCTARRAFEAGALASLAADSGGLPRAIATVAGRPQEPRGAASLAAVADEMRRVARIAKRVPRSGRPAVAASLPRGQQNARRVALPAPAVTLLMFGGKGGVGKTTCATATALRLAADDPRRQVLLLSADPAHSIGDVLGLELHDEPQRIPGAPPNLRARELDAAGGFEAVKRRYRGAIDALFDRAIGDAGPASADDRAAMHDLLELAPPGLDELIAIADVAESLSDEPGDNRLVVLDTAPTGHALRLLEMPTAVHGWVKALMGIVLKYQPVVGIGALGDVLLRMSQGLGRLRTRLSDPGRTAFVVVTRAAELPAAETRRLLKRLRALDIHVPAIVVNAVGAGACGNCAAIRRHQQRALSTMRNNRERQAPSVLVAPAVVPPPHGAASLQQWERTWAAMRPAVRGGGISSR